MLRTPIPAITRLLATLLLVPGPIWGDEATGPDHPVGKFVPVDTNKMMGSPHPEPLEAVRAFPQLSFDRPIELTYASDESNRLFVVEQQGTIYTFENRDDVGEKTLFLDLRDVVSREGNEEGLLGLAFHSDFKRNGEFFVYYSTKPRASIISRFKVQKSDPQRADRASEEVLLRIPQPYDNHNGGSMKFGPDGYLYIGLGDGGLANDPHENGQNLKTLLGSILRIDVNHQDTGLKYAIPKDNPFAQQGDGVRGEIWAYGFRNVWRLAFNRKTGELWAGDVGQDRFEEVNRVVKGGNYGWNAREGFHPFTSDQTMTGTKALAPLAEYFHGDGESVTGGLVYRGKDLPDFQGHYFYADYMSGIVWTIPADKPDAGSEEQTLATDDAGMDTTSPRYGRVVARTGLEVAAFGEDPQGRMFLLAFDGKIYRLSPRPIDVKSEADAFPKTLSDTGLFSDVRQLKPVKGIIPYRVNLPLWSDGAEKERWIALPAAGKVKFSEREKWEFPVGTVFIKTFFKPTGVPGNDKTTKGLVRLETRLFVHTPRGWQGHTYVWNDEQTEATLLDGSATKVYEVETSQGTEQRTWYFPSSADCMACHTKAAGFVLGPTTRQFNLAFNYGAAKANQIRHLSELGVFSNPANSDPGQLEAYADWQTLLQNNAAKVDADSYESLARAYLDVNCSICHQPKAMGQEMDLRFHTSLADTKLVEQKVNQETLGPEGTLRLKSGDPAKSEIVQRMERRGHRQMPPLATRVKDEQALRIIQKWILQLKTTDKFDVGDTESAE
jgi:uncharacterized repeat protein (TIGR03806 family)